MRRIKPSEIRQAQEWERLRAELEEEPEPAEEDETSGRVLGNEPGQVQS